MCERVDDKGSANMLQPSSNSKQPLVAPLRERPLCVLLGGIIFIAILLLYILAAKDLWCCVSIFGVYLLATIACVYAKRLEGGLWIFLFYYFLTVLFYQAAVRPFWVYSFGPPQIASCTYGEVTLPSRVPRSIVQEGQPLRFAEIRVPQGCQIRQVTGGFIAGTPPSYKVWVSPDFPRKEVVVEIQPANNNGFIEHVRSLPVESKVAYVFVQLFDLLFGISVATGAGIASIGGVAWKIYHDWYQRQETRRLQELQERTRVLERIPPSRRGIEYLHLWESCRQGNKQKLSLWWKTQWATWPETERWLALRALLLYHWLPEWREALISLKQVQSQSNILTQFKQSEVGFPTKVLDNLEQWITDPPFPPATEEIKQLLNLVGLEKALSEALALWLRKHLTGEKTHIENADQHQEGGAGKRLEKWLQEWGDTLHTPGLLLAQQVLEALERWPEEKKEGEIKAPLKKEITSTKSALHNNPNPFQIKPGGVLSLWPTHTPPDLCTEWANAFLSPFGPLKAEQDPRLSSETNIPLGMFWEGHPLWQRIQQEGHLWIHTTPGCGASALIWIGRERYRYWGSDHAGFSFYLPLYPSPVLDQTFTRQVARGLRRAILRNLLEDPTWFLAAPTDLQRPILTALRQGGSLEGALEYLSKNGLPTDAPAYTLLRQRFLSAEPTNTSAVPPTKDILQAIRESLPYGSRPLSSPPIPLKVFVEILPDPSQSQTQAWVSFLHRHCDLWAWGDVVVFAPAPSPFRAHLPTQACPCNRSEDPNCKKLLIDLLAHRITQSGAPPSLLLEEMGFKLSNLSNAQEAAKFLVAAFQAFQKESKHLPKDLIAWGNQKLCGR